MISQILTLTPAHLMSSKHVNYTQGQVLGVDDFQTEQNYWFDKHRRHNRYLHGWGVVWGLSVSMAKKVITVEPGFALDCLGNELELEWTTPLPLATSRGEALFLVLQYKECPTDLVPIPGEPDRTEQVAMAPSRILETVELLFRDKDFLAGHKCLPGRKTCGKPHPVPIARIKPRAGAWILDRKFAVPHYECC